MRKLLGIALVLVSMGFVTSSKASSTELAHVNGAVAANAAAQWQRGRNGRRYNRRPTRVVTRSRVVRLGRRVYRETYQVRYLANGATSTRVISRVRIS
jgi:hypothetical protein